MKILDLSLRTVIRSGLLVGLGAVLVLGAGRVFSSLFNSLDSQEQHQLLLADYDLAQAENKITKNRLRELNKKHSDLLKAHNAKITQYVELEAKYTAVKEAQGSTTSTPPPDAPPPSTDCLDSLKGEKIVFSQEEHNYSLEVTAERIEEYKWDWKSTLKLTQTFKLELVRTTHLATGESSMHAQLYELDAHGQPGKQLSITKFVFADDGIGTAGFRWFSPTLKLGLYQPLVSSYGWVPTITVGVAPSKYVNALNEDVAHFFQASIGVSSNGVFIFSATPASYNLGGFIPLVSSLWIGLDFGVDTKGSPTFGISLTTSL